MPVVALAAGLEVLTACLLLLDPGVFARLILGLELSADGAAIGHLAGISLLALALACWPDRAGLAQSVRALLVFSLLCAVYLAWLGLRGEAAGILLWPAAATHAALAVLLARQANG